MLLRNSQIGVEIQADEDTPATLASGDFSGNTSEHSFDYNFEYAERNITRASMTPLGALPGGRMGTIKCTEEVVGGNADIATDAPWHRKVRVGGFSVTQLKAFTVGARSGGEFAVGQRVGNNATEGSATATGIVAYLHDVTTDKLVILPLTGNFANGETVYAYTGAAVSATIGSVLANAGAGFRPLTETEAAAPPCATVERRMGGEVHRIVSARGKFTMAFEWGLPLKIASEMMGPVTLDGTTGRPDEDSAFTPATVGIAPTVCLANRLTFGSYSPVVTKLEIQVDNTLAARKTMGDSLEDSGYLATRIGDRKISVTMDPEYQQNDVLDIIGRAALGTTVEIVAQAGVVTTGNGLVVVYVPAAQITQNPSFGDRDGIVAADITMTATGTSDDELYIFHVFL